MNRPAPYDVTLTDAAPQGPIAALFAEHRLGLVRLAVLLVGDRRLAEDIVQDVRRPRAALARSARP